ncbi:MAG: hypothetical protein GQ531_02275 [Sulfurovum sp.]|nr:hypothetical protein [Sulfurovum sp.]
MKKVKVLKACDLELKPFVLADFTQDKETQSTMKKASQKVTKKALKSLANDLGLDYDERQISFAKKILTAYLER